MRLDSVAHFLYTPTMRGQRMAVARWHHRVHLMPGWLFRFICDRFEASLWPGDDEPLEKILDAYEHGVKGVTAKPQDYCPHILYSSLPGLTCGCGLPIANVTTAAASTPWHG